MPGGKTNFDEIAARFENSDRAELTKAEWEWLAQAWTDRSQLSSANHHLAVELERVRRIARPLWRTAKRVYREMRAAQSVSASTRSPMPREFLGGWIIDLGMALTVDIRDARPGDPIHSAFRR